RPGTGSATHSSMGLPSAPNPLNRSLTGASWLMVIVGAFVAAWEPATGFGSVARQTSATTAKDITTIILSDFMYFPPERWVLWGPNGKSVVLEAGLISEEHYLHGART